MKKIVFLLIAYMGVMSCNSDDNGGDVIPDPQNLNVEATLRFSQNWEGVAVTSSDFDTTVYTNLMGHELTISRIRYLLSKIILTNTTGDKIVLSAYNLIDLSDVNTFNLPASVEIPKGTYTLSMVYGFDEEDNVNGAYGDLNVASWNWPEMLGGGYHFMQFDGMYNVNSGNPQPFNYHNGTARVSPDVFEQNFLIIEFPSSIDVQDNVTVEIKMDISEWFKNPYTWDLDVYNTPLMPNYEAQKLMNQNAASVFSASITQ